MPLLPTALLILLSTAILPTNAITPTATATSTLIPPYGTGPATYYASIIGSDASGTTYSITCLPAPTDNNTDACLTARYGTHPQTFYQGPSSWRVSRPPPTPIISNFRFNTTCAPSTTVSYFGITGRTTFPVPMATCGAVPSPMACRVDIMNKAPLGGLGVEKSALCDLEVRQQEVLMVETMPTPTTFTDIGSSHSETHPVTTVTLYKQGGAAGLRNGEEGRWVVAIVSVLILVRMR